MRFGILGRLEVAVGTTPRRIDGQKQRALLAALLVHPNDVVSTEQLAGVLWGDEPAADAANALHTQVSRLRARLDGEHEAGGRIVREGAGYRLRVEDHEVDALEFEARSREARDALAIEDWRAALDAADRALRCWRGPALDDFAHLGFAQARASQLEEQRLITEECRIEAGLALGRHRELTADLQDLVVRHPLRESLWCQLMLALYRSGRQGDALRSFERIRRHLADELGINPCVQLVRLERAILDQDPSLDWREPRPGAGRLPAEAPHRTEVDHNLPAQHSSFVGRGAERAMVASALAGRRLVTVSGSGGCGKTRLALAVAEDVLDRFPDGVWFVDLASVSDPALVARAMAAPLGAEANASSQLDHLCDRLDGRGLLFVLDGCEHLIRPVADTVEAVLARCDTVRFLATSRDELRIAAELPCRVPALSLPVSDSDDEAPFLNSEAVQLFVERARERVPDFQPSWGALDEIARICELVHGIPLAIEVAAARVDQLTVAEISERLEDLFRLLAQGRRRGLSRQRTLQATLGWSQQLMDASDRRLFTALAVFVGEFGPGEVDGVAGAAVDADVVPQSLDRLVARSLVRRRGEPRGTVHDRLRLLDPVREAALTRLEQQPGEAAAARARHAATYAALAVDAEHRIHSPEADVWLRRVRAELPNLRAAVEWALAHGDPETAMRLAGGLRWYFGQLAMLDEAAGWFAEGLRRPPDLPPEVRLKALTAAGTVAVMRGDIGGLLAMGESCVELARDLGDEHELAISLNLRGTAAVYEADVSGAIRLFEEAHELLSRLDDPWCGAWILMRWALASYGAGRIDESRARFEEALATFRAIGDTRGQVAPLVYLTVGELRVGHDDEAHRLAIEALDHARSLNDRQLEHIALAALGRTELSLGRLDEARTALVRSVRSFPGAYHEATVAMALEGLAILAVIAGRPVDAVAVFGFTGENRRYWERWPIVPWAAERQRWLDKAQAAIGADRAGSELRRGGELGLDDAVALAEASTRAVAGGPDTPVSPA